MFTEEQKSAILERLHARLMAHKKQLGCPMCGERFFTLADAYMYGRLHVDLRKPEPDGPVVPMFALVCDCCGFVSLHAVGTIGLFPDATRDAPSSEPEPPGDAPPPLPTLSPASDA